MLVIPLLSIAIALATPLILAALGETLSQKSGVLNVGLEGYMLMGSMGGYIGARLTGNAWIGVLLGILSGLIASLIMAYLCITLGSDQVVCGIGINVLGWGFSSFAVRVMRLYGGVEGFKPIDIPILSHLPFLGPILFQHTILTYLTILLAIILAIILFRTSFGLRVRAVGEEPLAADTLGINVKLLRYLCVLLCGAMAGFGGSFYTLAWLREFFEGITAGRGFIALATVIISGWNPYFVTGMCFFFAAVDGLALRFDILQYYGLVPRVLPYPFFRMIPYILSIIVLLVRKRLTVPKALGVPYKKI